MVERLGRAIASEELRHNMDLEDELDRIIDRETHKYLLTILEKDAELAQKDEQLTQKDEQLAEKDRLLAEERNRLAELQREIEEMKKQSGH
jgi:septal ring factor EnvC (AmiA/AmiB activator)